jgi:5-methyltetrahydropteroyltriglutamate--homocysteine methyltransferase
LRSRGAACGRRDITVANSALMLHDIGKSFVAEGASAAAFPTKSPREIRMSQRTKPPFRAEHVGSLIRPDALVKAREGKAKGEISQAALLQVQQEAIRDIVRLQEELGFRAINDGEFNRGGWQNDFQLKFTNVTRVKSRFSVHFHSAKGEMEFQPPTLEVSGKLARPAGIFIDDFRFLKSIAHGTPKITIPSPTAFHFRGGRDAVDKTAYPDMADFFADLTRVYREEIADLVTAGCRYLQIDDVNLAYLCDPNMREQVRTNIGEDPAKLPKLYAKLINDTIADRPKDMTICLHLCRGNSAGNWVADGAYDPVADLLFNEIDADGYFLEYDSPRAGGFEPLRYLPKGKIAVLGLVTTKHGGLEKKDDLKRRIDEATRYVDIDQLAISPQCGFSPSIEGLAMTYEEELAKLRLVVETAREVWGTA